MHFFSFSPLLCPEHLKYCLALRIWGNSSVDELHRYSAGNWVPGVSQRNKLKKGLCLGMAWFIGSWFLQTRCSCLMHIFTRMSPPGIRTHITVCGNPSLPILFPELSGAGGVKHGGVVRNFSACFGQTPIGKELAPDSPPFWFTHCSLGTLGLTGGSPPFGGKNNLLREVWTQMDVPTGKTPSPRWCC